MKIVNYLSAINLFVVLLMSFKTAHDTSLIHTNKYAHNMLCNSRILGNTPSNNTEEGSNQTDGNTDSNPTTSDGGTNTSDQKSGENAEKSQGTSENASQTENTSSQVETPAAPAKTETTQSDVAQPDSTNGTESQPAGEKVTLLSSEEEEEEDEEDDDEEYDGDCNVNNGGCGEGLICEKMQNGAIKCSCPEGYKFNGTSCIGLLSADSINYGFCGIIMIAITIISLLY
ncbi:merozoite surface protein 4/5, putative [Plasmodium vinckei vinckei]|uniref:Merozoite surface protein 4/5, putative n=1 Tax=Plasmodium vinckei vinckei TaxID=54757 RepID=A0A081I9T5_PLAVN|nr:merozoite surface protein 4/5, putative [Plasmodium vinckei vinckei]KEG00443.1 hypothetical protein YYE_04627 [Plasmodium vinckei vinckei]VEV54782.1 merozoite surface protein 4/5, putative [Plasmodium vinckei vinckei]